MRLRLLPGEFAVLKRDPGPFPVWLTEASPWFVARTSDELSVMCPVEAVPGEVVGSSSTGYRCLRVDGDLAFDAVGVVAGVSRPLADAGLSLFLVSTHDRDYVFVSEDDLPAALAAYDAAGFEVVTT